MTAFALAWRTARRYRARAVLAIVGVAVIGALNFDMLLLSHGLLLSFADLINSTGYDIRVVGSAGLPLARLPVDHASQLMAEIGRLAGSRRGGARPHGTGGDDAEESTGAAAGADRDDRSRGRRHLDARERRGFG